MRWFWSGAVRFDASESACDKVSGVSTRLYWCFTVSLCRHVCGKCELLAVTKAMVMWFIWCDEMWLDVRESLAVTKCWCCSQAYIDVLLLVCAFVCACACMCFGRDKWETPVLCAPLPKPLELQVPIGAASPQEGLDAAPLWVRSPMTHWHPLTNNASVWLCTVGTEKGRGGHENFISFSLYCGPDRPTFISHLALFTPLPA